MCSACASGFVCWVVFLLYFFSPSYSRLWGTHSLIGGDKASMLHVSSFPSSAEWKDVITKALILWTVREQALVPSGLDEKRFGRQWTNLALDPRNTCVLAPSFSFTQVADFSFTHWQSAAKVVHEQDLFTGSTDCLSAPYSLFILSLAAKFRRKKSQLRSSST